MQERNLYEYAVIRYVPVVERGEFVNVGLAMMCKRRKWFRFEIRLAPGRIKALFPNADLHGLSVQLQAFADIAEGKKQAGPIAALPVEERFRWITAVKSCCLQSSPSHPGMTDDLDNTFVHITDEMLATDA